MGVSFNGHAGAIDWIQSRFKKHRPATLYYDELRTPTYTDCLNELCETALANSLAGLYHAGGPRGLSLYEVAQVINRVGGYDPALLHGCLRQQAGPIPPRAGDVRDSLADTTLAKKMLGHDPKFSFEEGLRRTLAWYRQNGFITRPLPGSPTVSGV